MHTVEPGADAPLLGSGGSRLEVRGISKTFGASRALIDAELTVLPGEIHGLIGQNGSGKSTLVKVLSGYHSPDTGGEVMVDGTVLSFPLHPRDVRKHGLAVVHQDLGLIDDVTVAENIRIGSLADRRLGLKIRWKDETEAAARALHRLDSDIDPLRLARTLKPTDRAIVAIARAIQHQRHGGGVILFDESTRSLPRDVLQSFYETLQGLAASGTALVVVSHRLDEVLYLCDHVTILRDGRTVACRLPTADTTEEQLATILLGREFDPGQAIGAPSTVANGWSGPAAAFSVTDLTGHGVTNVNFDVRAGEIVGLTGLPGSGYEEIPYLVAGAGSGTGAVRIGDTSLDLSRATVSTMIDAGVVFVPERRERDGLAMSLTVLENLTLPRVSAPGRRYALRRGWQLDEAKRAVKLLDIKPPDPEKLVANLSGGNQQKVLLAKWLFNRPKVLLLLEPTQGVDVGARQDLAKAIRAAAADGCVVVLSSGEPQDLATICDRVLVTERGRIARQLTNPFSVDDVIAAVYGRTPDDGSVGASASAVPTTSAPPGEK